MWRSGYFTYTPVWLKLSGLFFAWRILLFFWTGLVLKLFPYQPEFPYSQALLVSSGLPDWLYAWANFDGVHYLTIATRGYQAAALIQAFFPLYPWLISLLLPVVKNPIAAGLLLSNLAAWLGLLLWYQLIKKFLTPRLAWWAAVWWLLQPTSFYLVALYSESLFLLWLTLCFWSLYHHRHRILPITSWLLSFTRVTGVGLVPALLWQAWQSKTKLHPSLLIAMLASLAGLASYMLYLQINFHDSLLFFHVQDQFGADRSTSLILYPQVIYRYFKILAGTQLTWRYYAYWQEFVYATVGLFLIWRSRQAAPAAVWFFSLVNFLLPTLTGNFSSMPRYFLPSLAVWWWVIPQFVSLKSWQRWFWLGLSAVWLLLNTSLFLLGHWLA